MPTTSIDTARMISARVPPDLAARLKSVHAAAREAWPDMTLTDTALALLLAGLEAHGQAPLSRPSCRLLLDRVRPLVRAGGDALPEGPGGPRVRMAFRCPDSLHAPAVQVHARLREDWPTVTLTDVIVGLLHAGMRSAVSYGADQGRH